MFSFILFFFFFFFFMFFFFFNDTATTEIYTLSLHDALPILVGRACEKAGERQRRVVARPLRRSAVLEAVHAFARQFVRPRARLSRRLVRAVEVHHDLPRRRLAQDGVIAIDHLLRFVIEEIDLRAGDAERLTLVEERALVVNGCQRAAVLPQPDADMPRLRVVHERAHLLVGPALPEPFDDVILETELLAEPREAFYAFERVLAAIEEPPDGAAGTDPAAFALRASAPKRLVRKQRGIRRRREVVHDGGVH